MMLIGLSKEKSRKKKIQLTLSVLTSSKVFAKREKNVSTLTISLSTELKKLIFMLTKGHNLS